MSYLIRPAAGHAPLPSYEDKQNFCDVVQPFVNAEASTWDPLLKKGTEIVNIKEVKNILSRGNRDPYFWEEMNTAKMIMLSFLITFVMLMFVCLAA